MGRTGLLRLLPALIALAWVTGAAAQPAYPPRADAFVDDYAQVIEPQDATAVRQILQDLQATRGVEAAVVTIGSIGDYPTGDQTIESFATHLFNTWGLGDAQRNDGVLILVAVDDRQVRIELGKGYDTSYEDRMWTVINEHFLSAFRDGRYSEGIVSGVRAMVHELTGVWPVAPGGDVQGGEPPSGLVTPPKRALPLLNSPGNALVGLGVVFFVAMGIYTVFVVFRDATSGRAARSQSASMRSDDDDDDASKSLFDNSSITGSSFDHSSSSGSSDSGSGGGGRSSGGGVTGSW